MGSQVFSQTQQIVRYSMLVVLICKFVQNEQIIKRVVLLLRGWCSLVHWRRSRIRRVHRLWYRSGRCLLRRLRVGITSRWNTVLNTRKHITDNNFRDVKQRKIKE